MTRCLPAVLPTRRRIASGRPQVDGTPFDRGQGGEHEGARDRKCGGAERRETGTRGPERGGPGGPGGPGVPGFRDRVRVRVRVRDRGPETGGRVRGPLGGAATTR